MCAVSSDILWVLVERRWREEKGREGDLGELKGRGKRVEGEICAGRGPELYSVGVGCSSSNTTTKLDS